MQQNAYFLSKIGADTAENEQHFAEILLKFWRRSSSYTAPTRPGPAPPIHVEEEDKGVPSVALPGARARCPCFGASVLKFSYLCGVYIITDAFFDSKTSLNGSETDLPVVNSRFAFHFEFAKF